LVDGWFAVAAVSSDVQMVLLPPPDSRMAEPVQWSVWLAAAVATVLFVYRIRGRCPVVPPADPSRTSLHGLVTSYPM
jgi:hypothetical protein